MAEDKDRLGDKLRDVQKAREDEYFARRDRDLISKLRTTLSEDEKNAIREFARMRCPKDLEPLAHVEHLGVQLEECPKCKGIFLDRGELEQLQKREAAGWLSRYLGRV
jgi:hypothetical protein